MQITIPAVGTRGDVQPMVALGKGLQAAGHTVTIATHAMFASLVSEHGLAFRLMQGANPKDVVDQLIRQGASQHGAFRQLRDLWHLVQVLKSEVANGGESCLQACQDADLVLYSILGYPLASAVAKKLGLREGFVALQPFEKTTEFPFLMTTSRHLGARLNALTYPPGYLVPWLPVYSAINAWVQNRLALPPFPWNYPLQWIREPLLHLYGFSAQVLPRPHDWPDHSHITGYWFLDQQNWQPPAELLDFLDAGPPPVYVGFGSTAAARPEESTEIVVQALEHSKQRGLLLSGWGGLHQSDLPDDVFKLESAPHDWLFPRMAAVVHHGGAGTTAAGLRAGVPTITVPFLLDQPFWGQRVAALGAGPAPIPRKHFSVKRLSAAIHTAVTDPIVRQRAADLGERIRAEHGVKTAVDLINARYAE